MNRKISNYLLYFFLSYKRQVFISIITIVLLAIGYRLDLIPEYLLSTPKNKTSVSINLTKPGTQQSSEQKKNSIKIIKEPLQKNTYRNVIEPDNIITSSSLTVMTETLTVAESTKKEAAIFIPKIAIVIDDLGIDLPRSAQAMKLKSPLSLSFITYAPKLKKQTKEALIAGHELWMHMPMEPRSLSVDPGPNVLLTGLPKKELQAAIQWNLNQFSNYVGVNNHMGSRFTSDLESIRIFMGELKKHNLMFLDSRTSSNSVAQRAAIEAKVPFIVRNIFIDHLDETVAIKRSLAQIEKIALKSGYAVAIGHPRDRTLREVGAWLKTIESKGFQLVPLSALIKKFSL